MARRKCPVCGIGWVLRSDVHTCSPTCSKTWRDWSPERRADRIQSLENSASLVEMDINKLMKGEPLAEPEGGGDMPETIKKWIE